MDDEICILGSWPLVILVEIEVAEITLKVVVVVQQKDISRNLAVVKRGP